MPMLFNAQQDAISGKYDDRLLVTENNAWLSTGATFVHVQVAEKSVGDSDENVDGVVILPPADTRRSD